MNTKEKMEAIIQNQDDDVLKYIAKKLMNDFRDGTDLAFQSVLSELERRMNEHEYAKFCKSLD